MAHRFPLYFAVAMAALLVVFSLAGDNGFVYVGSLLGVPVVSGVLAGRGLIRFWHAAAACLAVVALDVVFDETWAEDLVFFAVLGVVMVGLAALARLVTRKVRSRRARVTA
jgi:hypothetical protein